MRAAWPAFPKLLLRDGGMKRRRTCFGFRGPLENLFRSWICVEPCGWRRNDSEHGRRSGRREWLAKTSKFRFSYSFALLRSRRNRSSRTARARPSLSRLSRVSPSFTEPASPPARRLFDSIPAVVGRTGPPRDSVSHLDPAAVRCLASQHPHGLEAFDGGQTERIADKMPDNDMYLGLLSVLFQGPCSSTAAAARDVAVSL